jgi:hypothetical protein
MRPISPERSCPANFTPEVQQSFHVIRIKICRTTGFETLWYGDHLEGKTIPAAQPINTLNISFLLVSQKRLYGTTCYRHDTGGRRFLICKRTFAEPITTGCFWPQAVIGLSGAPSAGIDPRLPFTIDAANVHYRIAMRSLDSCD